MFTRKMFRISSIVSLLTFAVASLGISPAPVYASSLTILGRVCKLQPNDDSG